MAPKVDTSQLVILRTFVFAGDKNMPPSMSQKLGPLGLNAKKIGEDIAKACSDWLGCRVFVEIHAKDRAATIKVTPGTSAYIVKEMGGAIPRDRKKEKLPTRSGNITFDKVIKIAKIMQDEGKSLSKDFSGTVKQVLGSCMSCGCTVDGESPKVITAKINSGEIKC